MAFVSYQEKAFLTLIAKRLLRYEREAATRGETYHDLSALSPLMCGTLAKLRFKEIPGGYAPTLSLRRTMGLTQGELTKIAEEILDAPVRLSVFTENDLEYIREIDALTLAEKK